MRIYNREKDFDIQYRKHEVPFTRTHMRMLIDNTYVANFLFHIVVEHICRLGWVEAAQYGE